MGCKAFSPEVVGLAAELIDEPFHLVASHNQRGDGRAALHEIFQHGLGLDAPNVTVTKFARHPGIQGSGYVPYYALFDVHGDLLHHHQGGPYHGGNGFDVLDMVRGAVEEAPAIYVGKEPYERQQKLASAIASGEKLGRHLATLDEAIRSVPTDPEHARLGADVARHLQRVVEELGERVARGDRAALKSLKALRKELDGTTFGTVLANATESLVAKDAVKRNEAGAKALAAIEKRWSKLEGNRGTRGEVRNPLDASFRQDNSKALGALAEDLEALVKEHEGTGAAAQAQRMLALLR